VSATTKTYVDYYSALQNYCEFLKVNFSLVFILVQMFDSSLFDSFANHLKLWLEKRASQSFSSLFKSWVLRILEKDWLFHEVFEPHSVEPVLSVKFVLIDINLLKSLGCCRD
jgi:hypothetical protein